MRRPLVLWHRWFGLFAALWLFLMGATGAVLVFHAEIDRALNPDIFTAGTGPSRPVSELTSAAAAAKPGHVVSYLVLPHKPGEAAMAYLARRPDLPAPTAPAPNWQIFVDPSTAQVLAARDYDALDVSRRGIVNFLYKFHSSLHLGEWMVWLLGVVALLWTIDHIVSAVISFPNPARWRDSLRIRRQARGFKRTFDLHRAGGLWLFPVTLALAVTGIQFNLPREFRAAVDALSPLTPSAGERAPARSAPILSPPLDWDAALARAPGLSVEGLGYDAAKGLYAIYARDPRDIDGYGGREILVDAVTGRRLSDSHRNSGSAGDIIMAWQFPLHSGKAFGWWGRIAIFIAGCAVCVFSVTGVMLWERKRRASRSGRVGLPRAGFDANVRQVSVARNPAE